MNRQNTWDNLSLKEKAAMMKVAVQNGITTLPKIREAYNKFAEGGPEEKGTFEDEDIITPNSFKHGGKIYIKPSHRGKFTELKKRTGHSASWFKAHGTPAQKKMATFALNARKWKHGNGGPLVQLANKFYPGGPLTPYTPYLNDTPMQAAMRQLNADWNKSENRTATYNATHPVSPSNGGFVMNSDGSFSKVNPDPAINTMAEPVTEAASFMPVIGDAMYAGEVYDAAKQGNYGTAATLVGLAALPNVLAKPIKKVLKRVGLFDNAATRTTKKELINTATEKAEPSFVIKDLPGYQLKGLMRGNPLEKQLSKSGTISVNNIKAQIAKGSNVEKEIVNKVLSSERFANQKAIDYNAFRKATQDELITYDVIPSTNYAQFGSRRLGLPEEIEKDSYNPRQFIDKLFKLYPDRFKEVKNPLYHILDTKTGTTIDSFNKLHEYYPLVNIDVPKYNTFTFESARIPIGNDKHYKPTTLGHSRTYTTATEPNILHVMESQSDWAQNKPTELLKTYDIKSLKDWEDEMAFQNINLGQGYKGVNYEEEMKKLQAAKAFVDPETSYLAENYERRQLQENLKYAAEHGQTKMRYPTSETAAKIEGYSKKSYENVDPVLRQEHKEKVKRLFDEASKYGDPYELYEHGHPAALEWDAENQRWQKYLQSVTVEDYAPELKTILKKYTGFPKQFKKLYKDAEVRTTTDNLGNTWYEVDVPENYLNQEWQYANGGPLVQLANKYGNS